MRQPVPCRIDDAAMQHNASSGAGRDRGRASPRRAVQHRRLAGQCGRQPAMQTQRTQAGGAQAGGVERRRSSSFGRDRRRPLHPRGREADEGHAAAEFSQRRQPARQFAGGQVMQHVAADQQVGGRAGAQVFEVGEGRVVQVAAAARGRSHTRWRRSRCRPASGRSFSNGARQRAPQPMSRTLRIGRSRWYSAVATASATARASRAAPPMPPRRYQRSK